MNEKVTLGKLAEWKHSGRPISMLTCYDYATAVLLERAGIDSILVGDSLAQTILGHGSTHAATMDIMVTLTEAVRRGAPHVYLVGDMPFLSYQVSIEQAIANAGRFVAQAECDTVKLEVDRRHLDLVQALTAAGIPVMAHMGHRPQAEYQYIKRITTREAGAARDLMEDAQLMIEAGVSSLLLECVTENVARSITAASSVPVISCGSGPGCDGQVLVLHDCLGLPGAVYPKFSKTYAQIGEQITAAASKYVQEVREGVFPDSEHCYHMSDEEAKNI